MTGIKGLPPKLTGNNLAAMIVPAAEFSRPVNCVPVPGTTSGSPTKVGLPPCNYSSGDRRIVKTHRRTLNKKELRAALRGSSVLFFRYWNSTLNASVMISDLRFQNERLSLHKCFRVYWSNRLTGLPSSARGQLLPPLSNGVPPLLARDHHLFGQAACFEPVP